MNFKKSYFALLFLIFAVVLNSCGEGQKEEAKSMEQLRKENGVPVKITKIDTTVFEKSLTYYATLKGSKEQTKAAMMGGRIKAVKASVGSYVKDGQVIVEMPTDEPGTQYQQAKLAFENSKKTYERMKALLEAGETSQQNYDNVKTQYEVAKENFESVYKMLFIEAPFDGIITQTYVNQGDNVAAKDPLFTISQLNEMRARIWCSEEEISYIKKGEPAYLKSNGKDIKGYVSEVSLAMVPQRQAFYAEVTFKNQDKLLKSGITSEIYVKIYENPNAIILPDNVILKEGNKRFVFLNDNGKAVKRYIETGKRNGMDVEITDGLNPGDIVITEGLNLLEDGVKVNVIN